MYLLKFFDQGRIHLIRRNPIIPQYRIIARHSQGIQRVDEPLFLITRVV